MPPPANWCLKCEDRPALRNSQFCGLCAKEWDPGAIGEPDYEDEDQAA